MHILLIIVKNIFYIISKIVPRNKRVWVFIGWHRTKKGEVFADNSKHFLLFIKKNYPHIKTIWLSADKKTVSILKKIGICSYYERSIIGIFYQLYAGYFIIDAFLQEYHSLFSSGAKIIQLLHGKGLKKKGYAQKPIQKNDFIFGTSTFTNSLLPKEFTSGAGIYVTGYSRNDLFFDDSKKILSSEEASLVLLLETYRSAGKKMIMYAPTFRRGQSEFDTKNYFDIETAKKFAHDHNVVFLTSLHTKYRERKHFVNHDDQLIELPECDINTIMSSIDILITDYSSSYVDYLLLDRPIIFYVYDIQNYHSQEGLIDDYEEHMPGAKVMSQTDLFSEIKQNLYDRDTWKESRKRVRDLYHTYQDGFSSQRIVSIILNEDTD